MPDLDKHSCNDYFEQEINRQSAIELKVARPSTCTLAWYISQGLNQLMQILVVGSVLHRPDRGGGIFAVNCVSSLQSSKFPPLKALSLGKTLAV